MDEYFCPECGAILNEQAGFDPNKGTWECDNCGKLLMDEETYDGDSYEGIAWYCDECGDLLNKQKGFSDLNSTWICTKCYHTNNISEDDIYNSKEEYENSKKTNFSNIVKDAIYDAIDATSESAKKIYEEKRQEADMLEKIRKEDDRIEREKNRVWRRKHKKGIIITTIIIIFVLLIISLYIIYKQLIPVRYGYEELIGNKYSIVIEKLESSGFKNIQIKEICDLKLKDKKNEDIVTDVIIKNKDKFSANTKFFPSEEITIIYHTLEKIYPPLSSKTVKGLQYEDVIKKFEEQGFSNIKTELVYDIITGWITKDGEVKSITINGNDQFSTTDDYKLDAEVVISYHTFKKNK